METDPVVLSRRSMRVQMEDRIMGSNYVLTHMGKTMGVVLTTTLL